jgi:oxaloacetate decarboxylase (Na+ extruding) subunit alpha
LPKIDLIDTSIRDGNQSLWGATGLNTAMMLEIAPVMDRVGFGAIDFSTSTHMAVAVRFKKENPWDRLRLMRKAMPRTPLQFLTTGMRFISWELAHPEFMRLTFRLLIRNGIRRFAVMDSMNDMKALLAVAGAIRSEGDDIIAALTYSVSPVHTDKHYVSCAKRLAQSPAGSIPPISAIRCPAAWSAPHAGSWQRSSSWTAFRPCSKRSPWCAPNWATPSWSLRFRRS